MRRADMSNISLWVHCFETREPVNVVGKVCIVQLYCDDPIRKHGLVAMHQIPPVNLCDQSLTNSYNLNNRGTYPNLLTHLTHAPQCQSQSIGYVPFYLPPVRLISAQLKT